jgi:hypothetical protein
MENWQNARNAKRNIKMHPVAIACYNGGTV